MIYGYSLGELTAVIAAGVFEMQDALQLPLGRGRRLRGAGRERDDGRAVLARPAAWTSTKSSGCACGSTPKGKA